METKKLIHISLMTALSLCLSFIRLPIIPIAPFLTLDLSSLPLMILAKKEASTAIITMWLSSGLTILLHGLQPVEMIGQLATLVFNYIVIIAIQKQYSFWKLLVLSLFAMIMLNIIVILPLYLFLFHFTLGYSLTLYIIGALIPFNVIKIGILYILFRMLRDVS